MTKKQRAKYFKQQEKLRKNLPKQIPLHEQSIDLTAQGATARESLEKRQELTKSSRDARRKGIREANFLKTM
jgi:large subunit ribosomal protein L54